MDKLKELFDDYEFGSIEYEHLKAGVIYGTDPTPKWDRLQIEVDSTPHEPLKSAKSIRKVYAQRLRRLREGKRVYLWEVGEEQLSKWLRYGLIEAYSIGENNLVYVV